MSQGLIWALQPQYSRHAITYVQMPLEKEVVEANMAHSQPQSFVLLLWWGRNSGEINDRKLPF
eukprot:gnl/Chilomastix_caulleri/867.p2 GENE.gnl/Chilomastix_caulleri/867~~gnl/Chilomastix_caulleri/867.p2  ORF type:complete len:63 (+),score=9.00 gnl/Chilomastix_caulleri/867:283-471(+)